MEPTRMGTQAVRGPCAGDVTSVAVTHLGQVLKPDLSPSTCEEGGIFDDRDWGNPAANEGVIFNGQGS